MRVCRSKSQLNCKLWEGTVKGVTQMEEWSEVVAGEDEVVCRARDKLTFSDFYCKTRGWEEGGKEG